MRFWEYFSDEVLKNRTSYPTNSRTATMVGDYQSQSSSYTQGTVCEITFKSIQAFGRYRLNGGSQPGVRVHLRGTWNHSLGMRQATFYPIYLVIYLQMISRGYWKLWFLIKVENSGLKLQNWTWEVIPPQNNRNRIWIWRDVIMPCLGDSSQHNHENFGRDDLIDMIGYFSSNMTGLEP